MVRYDLAPFNAQGSLIRLPFFTSIYVNFADLISLKDRSVWLPREVCDVLRVSAAIPYIEGHWGGRGQWGLMSPKKA